MPRPFKKGIACYGSMLTPPFSRLSFVALNNDKLNIPFETAKMVIWAKIQGPNLQKFMNWVLSNDLYFQIN